MLAGALPHRNWVQSGCQHRGQPWATNPAVLRPRASGPQPSRGERPSGDPPPPSLQTPKPAHRGGGGAQPRWAVGATGAGAHQGQTSREGERDIWWTAWTMRGGTGHLGRTHIETQRGRLWTACGQRRVDSKNSQTTPATTSTAPAHQRLGSANTETTPAGGRSGRQNAATRRNMRREERVTVQGPVKEQQPDGLSHRGGGAAGLATALRFVGCCGRLRWAPARIFWFFSTGGELSTGL